MGKGERQTSTSMTQRNYDRSVKQGDETQKRLGDELTGATQQAHDLYGNVKDTYSGMTGGTGADDPNTYNKVSAQNENNISTGGYDPEQLNKNRGNIDTNVKTGGYDPTQVDNIQKQYGDLTAGGMGGINAESADKIRSSYTGLIQNGGLSDEATGAMRRQAAGSAQSVYQGLGQNLTRTQAASGFGGAGGETAQLARQGSQAAATAVTGANAEIGKLQQSGKIAGTGGLSQFESNAAQGQREAVKGAGDFEAGQAQNRVASVGQQTNLNSHEADNRLQASKAQQDLATGAANQRIQAAGGLVNLYNSDPGYVKMLIQSIQQSQAVTGTLTTEQAQIMQELSKQPGMFQTIFGDIMTAGKTAAGIATGIGG